MRTSSWRLLLSPFVLVTTACSNPECRDNEYRIADICYLKKLPDAGPCGTSGCDRDAASEAEAGSVSLDASKPDDAAQAIADSATAAPTADARPEPPTSNGTPEPSGGGEQTDAGLASLADGAVVKDNCPPNACNPGGKCISALDDWTCECATGYSGTGTQSCVDIDECAGPHVCTHASWPCAQTVPGGYTCVGRFAEWPIADSTAPGGPQPSFSATATTVTDKHTGLIWQRELPASYPGCTCDGACGSGIGRMCTHPEARAYCEGLTLDGATDWRLPGLVELESLLDYSKLTPTSVVAIDSELFPPPLGRTAYELESWETSDLRWGVNFTFGTIGFIMNPAEGGGSLVRCVRSPAPTGALAGGARRPELRFSTDIASDTVLDRWTMLRWTRRPSRERLSWGAARTYCRSLGMEVPSQKQLLSIVDPALVPTIDPVFGETAPDEFWTSLALPMEFTMDQSVPSYWTVNFANGSSQPVNPTEPPYVRCVR